MKQIDGGTNQEVSRVYVSRSLKFIVTVLVCGGKRMFSFQCFVSLVRCVPWIMTSCSDFPSVKSAFKWLICSILLLLPRLDGLYMFISQERTLGQLHLFLFVSLQIKFVRRRDSKAKFLLFRGKIPGLALLGPFVRKIRQLPGDSESCDRLSWQRKCSGDDATFVELRSPWEVEKGDNTCKFICLCHWKGRFLHINQRTVSIDI